MDTPLSISISVNYISEVTKERGLIMRIRFDVFYQLDNQEILTQQKKLA